jgi:hypothetical protein
MGKHLRNAKHEDGMNKNTAEAVRDLSLAAITNLSKLLVVSKDHCTPEEFAALRKGVGIAIGQIQMEILSVICAQYPELDDLK